MRQSSEHFMDEMLKDNSAPTRTEPSDQFEQIAKVIDDKIDNAMNRMMEKFNNQVTQVNEPDQVETPEETNDDKHEESNDEKEGE